MVTQYAKGYHFERRVSAHLRDEGYFVVESRGSHGPVDLIAHKVGETVAVQAKISGKVDVTEWNDFLDVCLRHGMVPVVACREGLRMVFWQLTGRRQKYVRQLPRRPWTADRVSAA
jgi:Holliday junction resolvase